MEIDQLLDSATLGLVQFYAREKAHTAGTPCGDHYCPVKACATHYNPPTEGATVPYVHLHRIISKIEDEAFEALDCGADAYNESQCDPTDDGWAADWYADKYNRLLDLAQALRTPGINDIGGHDSVDPEASYCPVCAHDRYPRDFGLCFECGYDPYRPADVPTKFVPDVRGDYPF